MPNNLHHSTSPPEIPVVFACQGQQLAGIVHTAPADAPLGVLMIVGGPQYRVGSHRQFVLLARHLASQNIPVMRFDVRGMGDSEGPQRGFYELDDDINAAINQFFLSCPTLHQVVLWGLCDGASAALFYAYQDPRVKGVVLLNPWVFTEQGAAKTYLKHYYLQRLVSKDFWRKVLSLKFDYATSLVGLLQIVEQVLKIDKSTVQTKPGQITKVDGQLPLPERMRECLKRFTHPVLLILSGRDLIADEFKETVKSDPEWQALLVRNNLARHDFAAADHTFSSSAWRKQVEDWTSTWIKQL